LNITCFCTLDSGLLTIKLALNLGIKINRVIGLNPKFISDCDMVSGFTDISFFCKHNKLDFKYVDDYSLKTVNPNSILKKTDIIWVVGWQRLLPSSFINFPNIATIGSHGSCDGILKGRGRSPQNWALIMGKKKFKLSLFKINDGVDSGDIILTKVLKYDNFDTIFHSYFKVAINTASSLNQVVNNPILIKKAQRQKGKPEYFPKRVPEDGFIDWSMSAVDIFNQIRSLSKPYPNARTIINEEIMLINKASFINSSFDQRHGKIINLFLNGQILVSCGKGTLIIEDYQIENSKLISVGSFFKSISMKKTVKNTLKRFKNDFPNKNINHSLLFFWRKRKLI
jgi:methionyl-tRNA formyltransferase